MSETPDEPGTTDSEKQQGVPDEALPEDVRPAEDNPLADPDHEIAGEGSDDED